MKRNHIAQISLAAALGLVFVPAFAGAETAGTTADLQAKIAALLQQLSALQAKVSVAPPVPGCFTLSNTLRAGNSGSEVTVLQGILTKDGETVPQTGFFGPLTKAAVVRFQEKYSAEVLAPNGLSAGTGIVGLSTRAKLNAIIACGGGTTVPTTPTTPTTPTVTIQSVPPAPEPNIPIIPSVTPSTAPSAPSAPSGLTATPLNGTAHTKADPDDLGKLNFRVSSIGGPLVLNRITVTFSGSAATPALIASADLENQNGQSVQTANGATFSTSTNSATWTFGSGVNGFVISAGTTYSFTLEVASNVVAGTAGVSQGLSASIANANDVQFTDGLDAAAVSGIGLPASAVPITINSVSYPTGQ